jgi:two-component system KDP operon response regulator KdpE
MLLPKCRSIMVVVDNVPTRNMLRMGLETQGYGLLEASSAESALALLSENPTLIIVDLDLTDVERGDLLRMLREHNENIPIIALSNKADSSSIVQALDLGADAYLTKPIGMNELFARIRNGLRRQFTLVHDERPLLRCGDLSVDLARRLVKVGEKKLKLTRKEYELLRILLQHGGKVLTHRFLVGELWHDPTDAQYLRVYVQRLRKKIEADPERPQLLLTENGIGYWMPAC